MVSSVVDHWTRAQVFEKKANKKLSALFFAPRYKELAKLFNKAAYSYRLAGHENEAGSVYKQLYCCNAVTYVNPYETAKIVAAIANCYRYSHIQDSIHYWEKSAKLFIQDTKIHTAAGCYKEIADLYKQQNDLEQANVYGQKAAELLQSVGVAAQVADQLLAAHSAMSQPTWLPPLNSHNNSHVTVHAVQGERLLFNLHKQPCLSLGLHVDAVFHSGDMKKTFPALSISVDIAKFPFQGELENHILDILDNYVPFKLDKAYYAETRLFSMKQNENNRLNKNNIIKLVSDFLKDVMRETKSAGYEKVRTDLTITNWIQLSANELEAYNYLYKEQDKEAYMKAISRPRKMDELFEEQAYKAVAKECERVNYGKHRETFDMQTCCVCMDKLGGGSKSVRRMDCSHVFHEVCVLRWFKTSMCPLCRYMLQKGARGNFL